MKRILQVIRWILYFVPSILVELIAYILVPFIALLPVRSELRTDRVKVIDNKQHTLMRDYLLKPVYWFQTHDNAVDEWWYGAFYKDHYFESIRNKTQEDYDNSWFLRYYCRWMWMWRNNSYGFMYNVFGVDGAEILYEKDNGGRKRYEHWWQLRLRANSFQLGWHLPIYKTGKYMSISIGWKAHDDFPRVLYANRIIGPLKSFKTDD